MKSFSDWVSIKEAAVPGMTVSQQAPSARRSATILGGNPTASVSDTGSGMGVTPFINLLKKYGGDTKNPEIVQFWQTHQGDPMMKKGMIDAIQQSQSTQTAKPPAPAAPVPAQAQAPTMRPPAQAMRPPVPAPVPAPRQ